MFSTSKVYLMYAHYRLIVFTEMEHVHFHGILHFLEAIYTTRVHSVVALQ